MRLFFNYSIDCELPPEGQFGGPATWEIADASTRGFVEIMAELGARAGTSLFVYPDVAVRQRALFREMADNGIEVALHLNTMRYSKVGKPAWLGSMSHDEQRDAIRMAKEDLEDVTGRPCFGFRACYLSGNHFTFPVLEELGFTWSSTSGYGRYNEEIYQRWAGAWPFPHHPSRRNKLIPGDMRIYEMPITGGIRTRWQGNPDRPMDLRAESTPATVGPEGELLRRIIVENLVEMDRRDQPVRAVIVGSHNTNPFADRSSHQHRNLVRVCRFAREEAEARGYEFVPSHFLKIKAAAESIGAF